MDQTLKIFITLIYSSLAVSAFTQSLEYHFKHFSTEDGLPSPHIIHVEKDMDGFIWISSLNSLSRYDGTSLENLSFAELGLPANSRFKITTDLNRLIWISGYVFDKPMVFILDPYSKEITSFDEYFTKTKSFKTSEIILPIYRNQYHEVFINVNQKGLFKYDGSFNQVWDSPTEDNYIQYLETEQKKCLAFKDTLLIINNQNAGIDTLKFQQPIIELNNFKEDLFLSIGEKSTFQGFAQYKILHLSKDLTQSFTHGGHLGYTDSNANLFSIDENGYGLIRTRKALMSFNFSDIDKISVPNYISDYPNAPTKVLNIFSTNPNIFWAVTEKGLTKITKKTSFFNKTLLGKSTRGIYEKDGILYVNTYKGGVQVDLKTNHIENGPMPGMYSGIELKDYKDELWCVGHMSLQKFNLSKDGQIKEYPSYDKTELRDFMSFVSHPVSGRIYVGGVTGLSYLDKQDEKIKASNLLREYSGRDLVNVRWFLVEGDSIWITTDIGIFLMNEEEKIIEWRHSENGFPCNYINHILEDEGGDFWLSSNGFGLIKWNRKTDTFTQITKKEGLSDNNVYACYQDDYGYFWLPTENGLNRFHISTGDNQIFQIEDGLTHSEFNCFSHHKDTNGVLYFGGINGITYFNPKDFLESKKDSISLRISAFKTLRKGQKEFTNKTKEVLRDNQIAIHPSDLICELYLTIPDFSRNAPIQYQYQIKGYHDTLQHTDKSFIRLVDLPYGNFKLYLKGQRSNGQWVEKEIDLIVLPPFYLKSCFWVFLGCMFIIPILIVSYKKSILQANFPLIQFPSKTTDANDSIKLQELNPKDAIWLKDLNQIILKHLSDNRFNRDFLAEQLEISSRQLQRRLKKLTNQTPKAYITEFRLQEAKRILEQNEKNISIKQIAHNVGFNTPYYFSKLFKERFGVTPSQYSEKFKADNPFKQKRDIISLF